MLVEDDWGASPCTVYITDKGTGERAEQRLLTDLDELRVTLSSLPR